MTLANRKKRKAVESDDEDKEDEAEEEEEEEEEEAKQFALEDVPLGHYIACWSEYDGSTTLLRCINSLFRLIA